MKRGLVAGLAVASLALGGSWALFRLSLANPASLFSSAPGLIVQAWPAANLTVGGQRRALPTLLSQDDLQKSLSLQWPGRPPRDLKLDPNQEEYKNSVPALRREFADSYVRLFFSWGWLGALFLGVVALAVGRPPATAPPREDRLEPGGSIGDYRLLRVLGQGATGTVWEATWEGRRVAIKVLSPTVMADPEFIGRFEREFDVARRFNHPRLVTCQALGQVKDTYYIAMDYLPGGSLRTRLDQGRPTVAEAVRYSLQIAQGLEHAHAMGVVHRDLKPDNVMLDADGSLALADFGLARATDSKTITVTGSVMGTPAYIAPELLCGNKATGASDVYALGIMLFEMLSGRLPFNYSDTMKLLSAHLSESVPPLDSEIPENLRQLVADLLAKEPLQRPSAAQVVKRLKAAMV